MRRFAALIAVFLVCQGAAFAQGKPVPVIGILALGNISPATFTKELTTGLSSLGYVEGRTIRIELRSAEGQSSRLALLAQELVAMRVDVLVAYQTPAVTAAKAATSDIPIVMGAVGDPVGSGFVKSLSHPGGNITGVSAATGELAAKNLELIKEAIPSVHRVAFLANEPDPFHKLLIRNVQAAAGPLGLQIDIVMAKAGDDFDKHFAAMKSSGAEAVLVQPSLPLAQVVASVAKSGLPAASPNSAFMLAGGLMAYSADFGAVHEQAASMIDKILKGRKPADLPVEVTTKFRLTLNTKAANSIGLKFPPLLLARADEVIE